LSQRRHDTPANFVRHEPCPECGSKDNLARYDDGHGYCFGCGHYERGSGAPAEAPSTPKGARVELLDGDIVALEKRGITRETCEHWNYRVGTSADGRKVQIANYCDDRGRPIAQKLRWADKSFKFFGQTKEVTLYGRWLWRDAGRMVVVTEGEIDALSVSQVQGNKWPVVSVPNGAQGAAKAVAKSLEWLCGFDKVVFMFDMDEPGMAAAEECAQLLPPGKAFIARLPLKDPNEVLQAGRSKELIDAIWSAKAYRPDGILAGADLTVESLRNPVGRGFELPYPDLNRAIRGLRRRELVLCTAGSGIGKSTWVREVGYHLVKEHGLKVGNVFLEESVQKTALSAIAIDNNVPLGDLMENPSLISEEAFAKSKAALVDTQFYYDHFGSMDSEQLVGKLNYMAVGLGCDFIILDHLSMVVSDQEGSGEGERKDIDRLMTRLRTLVERTGVGVLAIVHLKRPQGKKSFNEGGQVSLTDLRGSASLEQLSDIIVALERDQQSEDEAHLSRIRVLKNRPFGVVGQQDQLEYHPDTGRLLLATPAGFKPAGGDGDEPF
jgi:twinkle protein